MLCCTEQSPYPGLINSLKALDRPWEATNPLKYLQIYFFKVFSGVHTFFKLSLGLCDFEQLRMPWGVGSSFSSKNKFFFFCFCLAFGKQTVPVVFETIFSLMSQYYIIMPIFKLWKLKPKKFEFVLIVN